MFFISVRLWFLSDLTSTQERVASKVWMKFVDKFETAWREVITAYFEELLSVCLERLRKTLKNLSPGSSWFLPGLERVMSCVQIRIVIC
jgi:hypothetical protein